MADYGFLSRAIESGHRIAQDWNAADRNAYQFEIERQQRARQLGQVDRRLDQTQAEFDYGVEVDFIKNSAPMLMSARAVMQDPKATPEQKAAAQQQVAQLSGQIKQTRLFRGVATNTFQVLKPWADSVANVDLNDPEQVARAGTQLLQTEEGRMLAARLAGVDVKELNGIDNGRPHNVLVYHPQKKTMVLANLDDPKNPSLVTGGKDGKQPRQVGGEPREFSPQQIVGLLQKAKMVAASPQGVGAFTEDQIYRLALNYGDASAQEENLRDRAKYTQNLARDQRQWEDKRIDRLTNEYQTGAAPGEFTAQWNQRLAGTGFEIGTDGKVRPLAAAPTPPVTAPAAPQTAPLGAAPATPQKTIDQRLAELAAQPPTTVGDPNSFAGLSTAPLAPDTNPDDVTLAQKAGTFAKATAKNVLGAAYDAATYVPRVLIAGASRLGDAIGATDRGYAQQMLAAIKEAEAQGDTAKAQRLRAQAEAALAGGAPQPAAPAPTAPNGAPPIEQAQPAPLGGGVGLTAEQVQAQYDADFSRYKAEESARRKNLAVHAKLGNGLGFTESMDYLHTGNPRASDAELAMLRSALGGGGRRGLGGSKAGDLDLFDEIWKATPRGGKDNKFGEDDARVMTSNVEAWALTRWSPEQLQADPDTAKAQLRYVATRLPKLGEYAKEPWAPEAVINGFESPDELELLKDNYAGATQQQMVSILRTLRLKINEAKGRMTLEEAITSQ